MKTPSLLLALTLTLAAPASAQDTTAVRPGDTACAGFVVPDVPNGTVYRCDVRGPNDMRFLVGVFRYLRVTSPMAPPLAADWSYSCQALTCTFDGTSSTGAITAWRWTAGAGSPFGDAAVVVHTFPSPGSGALTLTVADDSGGRDSLTQEITVGAPEPPPPDTTTPPLPDTLPPPPPPPPSAGWRTVFVDGFESGNLNTAQAGYRWASSNSGTNERPAVTTTRARSGTHALEFTFQGNPNPADDAFSEQRFALGERVQSVALDYWFYMPADYVHRDATGPDNNKFLRLWGGNTSDGNNGYSQYLVKLGYSTQLGAPRLIAEAGVNRGGVGSSGLRGWSPGFTAAYRDRWVHVRVEVTLGDEWLLLIDDVVVSRNVAPRPTGAYLDYGYLMGWANTGFDATTRVWVDDLTIQVR